MSRRQHLLSLLERSILRSKSTYLSSLVDYARFFFTHRYARSMPSPWGLSVVDQSGARTHGNPLYLDRPLSDLRNKSLSDLLPTGTIPFIHSDYLIPYNSSADKAEWHSWLRLGLSTAPWVFRGPLSPEFRAILEFSVPLTLWLFSVNSGMRLLKGFPVHHAMSCPKSKSSARIASVGC